LIFPNQVFVIPENWILTISLFLVNFKMLF
jgi:hypothetical protein